ncbi:MAG: hypothetical protein U0414_01260 [Polyangiaceae bacterium]
MATGSSRLVTARWVGIGSFLIAASIHTATMAVAARMPPIQHLLGVAPEREAAIDLDLDSEELATVKPVASPKELEPERPKEPDAPPAAEVEREEEKVAPATVARVAPQPLGVAPPEVASEDPEGTDESAPAGAPNGAAPPGAPVADGAPGPVARGGSGDLVDEYGDSTPGPAFGSGSVVSQFALGPVAAAAPTAIPGAAPVTGATVDRVLNSTVQTLDKKKGITFPGAGVVSGTVTTAVRSVSLPHNARATIEVTIAPGGKVTSTRVVSASAGDAGAWEGAAKAIQGSLVGQTLQLGDADKTGAVVRLSVVQKHVYPTGTAKGADVKPVCANQVINDLIDSADNKPASPNEGSTVPLLTDEHGRPCIPIGVSAVADASNIGAEKHIEVQTSMDVTIPGQKDLPVDMAPVNTDAPWVDTGKAGPRPTLPQKMRKRISDKKKKK